MRRLSMGALLLVTMGLAGFAQDAPPRQRLPVRVGGAVRPPSG